MIKCELANKKTFSHPNNLNVVACIFKVRKVCFPHVYARKFSLAISTAVCRNNKAQKN